MILVDENLESELLIDRLREAGIIYETVKSNPNLGEGSTDEAVIEYAKSVNAIVLTEDNDFNVHLYRQVSDSPSVILVRTLNEIEVSEIISGIKAILNDRTTSPRCFIAIIQKDKVRLRELPLRQV